MSISGFVGWQGIASVGMGIGCGVAEFAWHTIAQKVAMVTAKLEFKERVGPDDGLRVLSFEILDKQFFPVVILGPLIEEILFRGLAQPILAYGTALCFSQLAAPVLWGISKASFLSIAIIGAGFGLCHYPGYEKGGAFPVAMSAVAGVVFGVVREQFGLIASIAAHMTANFDTGLLDKYWPEFLEFPWEKKLRLLRPGERELELLREAVKRIDGAVAQPPQKRSEFKGLRSEWVARMQGLERTLFGFVMTRGEK